MRNGDWLLSEQTPAALASSQEFQNTAFKDSSRWEDTKTDFQRGRYNNTQEDATAQARCSNLLTSNAVRSTY